MAQVLPNFYGAFTGGRKDAIDFQNLITAQKQTALMNPLEVQGKQINNRYVGSMADTIGLNNQVRTANVPAEIKYNLSGYEAGTGTNQLTQGYNSATEREAQFARDTISDPVQANAAGRRIYGIDRADYSRDQVTPRPTWTPPNYGMTNESELDAWARARGYTKPDATPAVGAPNPTSMASSNSYNTPERMYQSGLNMQDPNTIRRTADLFGVSDVYNTGTGGGSIAPEAAVQKIIAAGMEPTMAQDMVDNDIALGRPIGMTAALAMQESNFNIDAVNPESGAAGLFQVMPNIGAAYGGENYDYRNAMQNMGVAKTLMRERNKRYPDNEDFLRSYNGNIDLSSKTKENLEFPQKVRDAYMKLFGFAGF